MNIRTTVHYRDQWLAIDEDTYAGPGSPIGIGRTETAAVNDLRRQIEKRAQAPCPCCGMPLIDGCCTPECDAIRAEDAREERETQDAETQR